MTAMTLNGITTYETCPVCKEPDVRVDHGFDATGPMHYWHCPECGPSIVSVLHDCPSCATQQERMDDHDELVRFAEYMETERDEWKARAEAAEREAELLRAQVAEARVTAEYWKAEHLAGNAKVERLRTVQQWQSIDTAPEDTLVLVYSEETGYSLAHMLLGRNKPWTMYFAGLPMLLQPLLQWQPTQWMAVPIALR